MANLDAVALRPPVCREQVGNETAVTFFWPGFGTQQRGSRRPTACVERLGDSPTLHQRYKPSFVSGPILGFAVSVEQPGSRRKSRLMGIADAGNLLEEILEVGMLGVTGELASAIEAHIDELFHSRLIQQAEKLFGSFPGETNGAQEDFHTIKNTRWLQE